MDSARSSTCATDLRQRPRAEASESLQDFAMAEWDDMVLVGTIARTHGLRGHVIVNPETDFVEERFRAGAAVWVRTGTDTAQLAIETMRVQNGRPVIVFEGYGTVEASESLVGRELRIPEQSLQPLEDGVFYHHQLAGCRMVTTAGRSVGLITRVDGSAAGSLLVVDGLNGEVLVPLAADICVTIDVQARVVVVDPPEGLLELNETRSSKGRLGSERSERPERSERSEQ